MIFLCGSLLNYPFYRFAIAQAKSEMRRELFGLNAEERKAAVTLTFTQEEYKKSLAEENELCVNGNWYDVISASEKDGRMVVSCFSDHKENLLNAWMNKVTKDDSQQNVPGKSGKAMKLAFAGDYLPSAVTSQVCLSSSSTTISLSVSAAVPLSGHESLPELPPRA